MELLKSVGAGFLYTVMVLGGFVAAITLISLLVNVPLIGVPVVFVIVWIVFGVAHYKQHKKEHI
jgi:hypothetical protein